MLIQTPGDETSNRIWRRVDHQGEFVMFEVHISTMKSCAQCKLYSFIIEYLIGNV